MIARIIVSEHPNEKNLEHFNSDHKEAVDGFLANINLAFLFKLVTSLLVISGYEDQKSTDSNLKHVRNGLMKGRKILR